MNFTENDIIRVVQSLIDIWKEDSENGYDCGFYKEQYKHYKFFVEDLTDKAETIKVHNWKVYIERKEN